MMISPASRARDLGGHQVITRLRGGLTNLPEGRSSETFQGQISKEIDPIDGDWVF
jgi:hypothetical protein